MRTVYYVAAAVIGIAIGDALFMIYMLLNK